MRPTASSSDTTGATSRRTDASPYTTGRHDEYHHVEPVDDAYTSTPRTRADETYDRVYRPEPSIEPTDDTSRLALAALTDDDIAAINASMGTSYARGHAAAPLLAYVIGLKRNSGVLLGPLNSINVVALLAGERFDNHDHQQLWNERIGRLRALLRRRETLESRW